MCQLPSFLKVSTRTNTEIFLKAILDIFTNGDPIDLLSVTAKLKDRTLLEKVGGAAYVTELVETVPAAGNAVFYAEMVQTKSTLRGLIHVADDIAEMAYGDPENIDETLDQAEKKVYAVTNLTTTQKLKLSVVHSPKPGSDLSTSVPTQTPRVVFQADLPGSTIFWLAFRNLTLLFSPPDHRWVKTL